MKLISLLTVCFFICFNSQATEKDFPFYNIPQNLLKNADAVKRLENYEFTIINTHSTKLRHHYVITILNESGDEHSGLEIYYNNLTKIKDIKGTLYNAAGNIVLKLKSKDIIDQSAVDDNNIAEDSRVKTHNFNYKQYPYTVEYEVETEGNQTFIIPTWLPQEGEFYSVEKSDYTITYPSDYKLRYKAFNYTGEPEKIIEKGNTKLIWKASNLSAIKIPFATSSYADITTLVYFAPSDFEIEGYKGSLNTWKDFGEFQLSLNKGRDVLPQQVMDQINSLTSGVTDEKEKIKILYNYLQKNTRYISVQLGIGGWQPFEATYVAKNGYGDCKALTNYMYSILKYAGIKSNYTVVYAGSSGYAKNRFVNDFSSNQFNHVILCVPGKKDSVWLECTSQNAPAGYMSDFTGNRKAVMITDNGGVVVSTPRYGVNENKLNRKINAKINEDGTLQMNVKTVYECIQQDNLGGMLNALSDQKIKERLDKNLPLSTYNVNYFNYKRNPGFHPSIEETLDITSHNYATVSGKRIFLLPNILNVSGNQPTFDSTRKNDLIFNYAFQDIDEIKIDIPEGYELESNIKNISLETPFGKYAISSKVDGNSILYSRMREQYEGSFPAKMQKEIIDFYNAIFKADRTKIVLVKKAG